MEKRERRGSRMMIQRQIKQMRLEYGRTDGRRKKARKFKK
jgi:hypothetical protein